MGVSRVTGTAAATVGTDILSGNKDQMKPYNRVCTWVAYIGANSAGEATVDLYVDETRVATNITSSATGIVMDAKRDVIPVNFRIPAGALLRAVVSTAGTVSATYLYFNTIP